MTNPHEINWLIILILDVAAIAAIFWVRYLLFIKPNPEDNYVPPAHYRDAERRKNQRKYNI